MKTIKSIYKRASLAIAVLFALPTASVAQITDHGYVDIDWQFNIPINTGFSDKAAGWGMAFDGGYYITDNVAVGGFLTFSTNNKYYPLETINLTTTSTITTDQQHSMFQLPFGVSARYRFIPEAIATPYIALKIGTEYSKFYTYYNAFETTDNSWGFYICPEIGTTIYFTPNNLVGLHIALYYNYATNRSSVLTYSIKGVNNAGFRLGLSF
ncbi:MAG: outer membrane beta-barrel protein [Bacteroidales bacterium]